MGFDTYKCSAIEGREFFFYREGHAVASSDEGKIVRCAYSIIWREATSGDLYAADWDYWDRAKRWSISCRPYGSIRWEFIETLASGRTPYIAAMLHTAMLAHFGIDRYTDEFPIDAIALMSPAALAQKRRTKEDIHGLPRLSSISDTAGSHIPAEEYS